MPLPKPLSPCPPAPAPHASRGARRWRAATLLTALTLALAACGGGDATGGDIAAAPEPAPAPAPAPAPTTLAITALSVSPTQGLWFAPLNLVYTFTVTNGSSTTSARQMVYAGITASPDLPYHWDRTEVLVPVVDAENGAGVGIPELAPGESYTATASGGAIAAQGAAWSKSGYLSACLFAAGVEAMTGCNATPVTLKQVDPSLMATVAGYGGAFPRAAAALDTTVTRDTTPLMSATFGWDRPGAFAWSPTLTDDQAWAFTAADGIGASITMPWGTFIESMDFAATAVTLAAADASRPLPFGRVLAAFDLAPADLTTEQAFTLRFTLSDAVLAGVSAGELVVFGADSDGRNLRLLQLVRNGDGSFGTGTLSTGLRHFGIVGLATMNSAQRDALAASWPRDTDAQMEAALGAASVGERQAALGATASVASTQTRRQAAPARSTPLSDTPTEALQRNLLNYYNDVIVPAFVAAYGGGEPEMEAAMRIALGWLRNLALSGLGQADPFTSLGADLWVRVNDLVDRHADKVKAQCTAGGAFAAFQRMLAEMRQLQLLGHDAKAQELADALGACSAFTVEYELAWADTNTNAALTAGVKGSVRLTAPTANMIKAGSLPNGDGDLAWTQFQSSTTDMLTVYGDGGSVIGSCSTTTTSTGTTGSQFTVYVMDYGLSFLKGGAKRPLKVLLWPYGTYNGQTHVPMGVHRESTSTCNGVQPSAWDDGITPGTSDPGVVNRGDGMLVLSAPWSEGEFVHDWNITRSGDEHPKQEQFRITVHTAW